jgi:hypothetical protein
VQYVAGGVVAEHPVQTLLEQRYFCRSRCVAEWRLDDAGRGIAACPHYRYRRLDERTAWETDDDAK